jgi:poly(A) polymerase
VLYRYASNSGGKLVRKAVIYTGKEHSIDPEKVDPDAKKIITHLRQHGFETYIVGGAVRDLLMGKTPKDFDIVTGATPLAIKRLFRNSRIIGKRFRLVHIVCKEKIFEVSTFRSLEEGTIGNTFGTIDDDVKRRDFTLNALYYDPIQEQVIDYVDGMNDIAKRRIMPVISLGTIFCDDPVRMVRAIKYAAMCGFTMPPGLIRKIKSNAHLLSEISPSRITEELVKIINSGFAYDIISLALKYKIYFYMQTSASSLVLDDKDFEQKYFSSLKEMDSYAKTDVRFGEKLSYLLYDFVLRITDWKNEIQAKTPQGELFSKTWTHCRNFILPMNPQRTELDYAIRLILKKIGIKSKSSAKRGSRRSRQNAVANDSVS